MVKFLKRLLDQRGVIHLLPLLILLVGIIAGVYLVQKSGYQIFKPKAAVKNIDLSASEGKDANGNPCYVREENGRLKTNCPEVKIKFTSPLETQGSSDAGPNMSVVPNISLVRTAYAVEAYDDGIYGCGADPRQIYRTDATPPQTGPGFRCPDGTRCGVIGGLAMCVDSSSGSPVIEGQGWYCDGDGNIHKDIFLTHWITDVFDTVVQCRQNNTQCSQDGQKFTCVAGARSGESPSAEGFVKDGFCLKDDQDKIYTRIGGGEVRVARFCQPGTQQCEEVEGGAECKPAASLGGEGWTCKDDSTLHKDGFGIGPIRTGDKNINCPQDKPICKPEGNGATCVAGEPSQRKANPANIKPRGTVVVTSDGGFITFVWLGESGTTRYRFFIDSNADGRVGVDTVCEGGSHGYFLCKDRYENGNNIGHQGNLEGENPDLAGGQILVQRNLFRDEVTYTWWVDALGKNGETIGISSGFEFVIKKAIAEEPSCKGLGLEFPNLRGGNLTTTIYNDVDSQFAEGRKISGEFAIFHCNTAGGLECAPDLTPQDFKEVILKKAVTLTVPNKGGSSSVSLSSIGDLPDRIADVATTLCGRYQVDVGVSCGVIGGNVYNTGRNCGAAPPPAGGKDQTTTTPARGAPQEPAAPSETKVTTCKRESKTWAQIDSELRAANYDGVFDHSQAELTAYNRAACPAGAPAPVGVGPTAPQQPAQPPQRLTTGYRFAESPTALANLSFSSYTPGGVSVTHPFADPANGPHFIFVQFQYNNSSSDLSQVFTATIELVGPSAPATQPAPPPPSAGGTPAVLYVGQLRIAPNPVKKDSSGNYPRVRFTVVDANKAWQVYYQNKEGANCGGSCDLNGWTALNAIEGAEGGVGGQGNTAFAWTPPAYIKGTHTIAFVDVQAGKVISPVDVVFQERDRSSEESSSIPPGSDCSKYATSSVCGGGFETYDKCIDDTGKSGSQLCSGGATQFYCVGSTNSNCDSRYSDTEKRVLLGTYQYSCSACPNLSGRSGQ